MARYLGIDIGKHALRGVLVRSALRKLELERYVEIPLVQPEGSPGRLPELSEAGRNLLRALGATPDAIIAGLAGEETSLRVIELPAAARKRVLIASALWGVVRPSDRIPYYRFSAKARLGRIGPPAAFWRPALAVALPDEEGELILDMRSGAYAAAWKPQHASLLAVRAFTEVGGKRKPVSHMAKATRGEVARALLKARKAPADPEAAAAVAAKAGFEVELNGSNLDVIVSE
jgi:hypothetical protein